jgi:hypothetical protein
MLVWTLTFVCVVATAALLGGAASWDGILLAARIGLVVLLALALLAGGRAAMRRMAGPWEEAASRHRPSTRRPYRNVGRVQGHAAAKREEHRAVALQARATRVFGEGRAR